MSAPNIVNVATITGKTFYDALADTNLTSLVLNVDVSYHPSTTTAVGSTVSSTGYAIASTISVPNDATLVVISKDTALYMEESSVLAVKAYTAGDLHVVVSYEEIS